MSSLQKIAIDVQTTLGQKTGFGYYVDNLVNALKKVSDRYEYALLAPKGEKDFNTPRRFVWDQIQFPLLAARAKVDLLHQPAFSVPVLFNKPMVVTVHDLIAVHYGIDIPRWSRQYFGRWMPYSYRYADHIIAVSHHTKKDIMRLMHVPSSKISVIYEALDQSFTKHPTQKDKDNIRETFGITGPFLLYIGTINPRKNLVFLVNVFLQLAKTNPDLQLVIAGKKGWYYDTLVATIRKHAMENRVILTDYISDLEKVALYSMATALVFPSLYEGFGLPVIEAMAAGLPVIASDRSSIPEVQGDAGLSLNPTDEIAWVKGIRHLLDNKNLQKQYSATGVLQANKFSWDKTAEQTSKVYDHILEAYARKDTA